jgi:2-polyprenyl-3-methyl-5-hydroxy-6-metoxy-1,4-benzoquinol methylase
VVALLHLFQLRNTTSTKMNFNIMPGQRELTPQQKVTQEWDAMAGEWDDLAGGYAAGFETLLWNKISTSSSQNAASAAAYKSWTVVDFGCGTGLLTDRLRTKVKQVIGIDVSSKMIEMMEEKIQSQEWDNVRGIHCVLAELDGKDSNVETKEAIEALYGTVDMIVASSVLTFIPENDVQATMATLGKLLKPGIGKLFHSDWSRSEAHHPNGMDEEKALAMYRMAGMTPISTEILPLDAGAGQTMDVFFGVAEKTL